MPLDPNIAGLLQFIESGRIPADRRGHAGPGPRRAARAHGRLPRPVDAGRGRVGRRHHGRRLDPGAGVPAAGRRVVPSRRSSTSTAAGSSSATSTPTRASAACCAATSRRSWSASTTGSRPSTPSRPRSTTATPRSAASTKHIDDFGGDATRLAVGGDSAGGNLAAVCAQLAHADGRALAAQLLVYPAVDLLGEYRSRIDNAEGYFLTLRRHALVRRAVPRAVRGRPRSGRDARATRGVSPLHAKSLEGLAPAVVATAEFDPLRDEGDAYAAALDGARRAGREPAVPGPHPRVLRVGVREPGRGRGDGVDQRAAQGAARRRLSVTAPSRHPSA